MEKRHESGQYINWLTHFNDLGSCGAATFISSEEIMTPIQEEYADKVRQGTRFSIKGYSIFCGSTEYPLSMAKAVGIKPPMLTAEYRDELNKKWNSV